MRRQASVTSTRQRSDNATSFGLQRLQGRNPARSASAAVAWKADILRPGLPRRAGRPAIDAGGFHRIEKAAVGILVARDDILPARVLLGRHLWGRNACDHVHGHLSLMGV